MRNETPQPQSSLAIVSAIAGTLFGIIVGYMLAMAGIGPAAERLAPAAEVQPATGAAAPPPQGTTMINEAELQNWRTILANDPRNTRAAIELGNRLYDAGRYAEAVTYYQQAFALDPRNVNVSTDLGTALWYTGRPDDAIAQFRKSLAVDPSHAQTLFNMGIVLLNGKQDAPGAIAAWEKLRSVAPGSSEASKAAGMIEEARARVAPPPVRSSS